MRYLTLFSVALATTCALGIVVAASAVALPTILPETLKSWIGKSLGEVKVEKQGGLATTECASATGEGTIEANGHSGLYHITFEKCEGADTVCTGLGDASGTILSLGSWHIVFYTLKATLGEAGVATLFLVDNIHFECGSFGLGLQEAFANGMVLCPNTDEVALTKAFEVLCKEGAALHPLLSKYYNAAGELTKITPLEFSEDEGTEVEGLVIGNSRVTVSEAGLMML
jgi:hypothetical protein